MSKQKPFKETDHAVIEAKKHTAAVSGLDKTINDAWWEMGKHCHAMHSRKLWEALELRSFGAWLDKHVKASRKTAYDAMTAWRELRDIPEGLRKKLPKQNAKILAKMPESKRKSNKWISAAINMSENEFKAEIEADKVGAEKAEEFVIKHFHFEVSQWQPVEKALDHLKNFQEIKTPEAGIEMLAAEYLSGVEA